MHDNTEYFNTFVVIYNVLRQVRRKLNLDRLRVNNELDVYCGKNIAFDFACNYILEHSDRPVSGLPKVAIVSDRAVAGYYYNLFENQFIMHDIRPKLITVNACDTDKSLKTVLEISGYLSEFDYGSNDWVVALGGGGVIDCAAFAARLYRSGCVNFLAVPTTVYAMTDCITSDRAYVNLGMHKDELSCPMKIGAALCDTEFLKSVPSKYRANGYAAVIRYSVLGDTGLISDLSEPGDMREFLERVYKVRSDIRQYNPVLLTLGSELAFAIDAYNRFNNLAEGASLALSIYSALPEQGRTVMRRLYSSLGLPYEIDPKSSPMIRRNLESYLDGISEDRVRIADYEDGKWVVRDLSKPEAGKIFEERIKIIEAGDGN